MKIETISVLQRKNLGNYEHLEISASAKIEENESAAEAIVKLKLYVGSALNGTEYKEEVAAPVVAVPVEEKPKKQKKKKEVEAVAEVAPAATEFKPIAVDPLAEEFPEAETSVAIYNSNIPEHKSIFAGYLSEKYGNSWKTANTPDKIKEFTTSLNGKQFLDSNGKIVSSFLSQVHEFFGA
jgi:hypothetical protein